MLFVVEPRVVADTLPSRAAVSRTAVFPAVSEVLRLIELLVGATVACGWSAGQKRLVLESSDDVGSKL